MFMFTVDRAVMSMNLDLQKSNLKSDLRVSQKPWLKKLIEKKVERNEETSSSLNYLQNIFLSARAKDDHLQSQYVFSQLYAISVALIDLHVIYGFFGFVTVIKYLIFWKKINHHFRRQTVE